MQKTDPPFQVSKAGRETSSSSGPAAWISTNTSGHPTKPWRRWSRENLPEISSSAFPQLGKMRRASSISDRKRACLRVAKAVWKEWTGKRLWSGFTHHQPHRFFIVDVGVSSFSRFWNVVRGPMKTDDSGNFPLGAVGDRSVARDPGTIVLKCSAASCVGDSTDLDRGPTGMGMQGSLTPFAPTRPIVACPCHWQPVKREGMQMTYYGWDTCWCFCGAPEPRAVWAL